MLELLKLLANPIVVIGLSLLCVYLLVQQRREVNSLADNHLTELAGSLQRIEASLERMARDLTWLRARANGENG